MEEREGCLAAELLYPFLTSELKPSCLSHYFHVFKISP